MRNSTLWTGKDARNTGRLEVRLGLLNYWGLSIVWIAGGGVMLQRSIMIAALMLLATPAAAEWTLPCIFGGCSITFVSPEYAAKPVQPLNPEAALAQINAYRTRNGRKPVVLDERLSRAAAAQSKAQAGRSRIGHDGSDGSKPMQRAARAGYRAKIASENVASGQKSFSDVMRSWEGSSGHRENLLRPEVTAVGVAMAKNSSGWPYWTLVLGAERANAKKDTEESAKMGKEEGHAQPQPLTKEGCKTAGMKWNDQSNVCG